MFRRREMFRVLPETVRFDGCALITGFHGIGAAGYWTIKYLVQKINAERVAFIDSDTISPVATSQKGVLVTPYEVFRKGDLAFFRVEVPPFKGGEVDFYRSLSEWVPTAGIREVALVGGLDMSLRTDESFFRIVHTRAYTPRGELALAKKLEDDHMIVGPVAILLNQFEIRNFPAYAVLAYASGERVDPRAAATAIDVLSRQYQFEVDVSPLIKGAQALETEAIQKEPEARRGGESIYT